MKTSVVVRCFNDIAFIRDTLTKVRRQTLPLNIVAFDNASTDGTTDVVRELADRVINVPRGEYVPGRVLNAGMAETTGEIVLFLNSDCTPLDENWAAGLIAALTTDRVAAVFGRQRPRPDCTPLLAKDTDDTFGDGERQAQWRHCFSMASSAVRRSVWDRMPFNEDIQYSEDIDWTWRARKLGFEIRYARDSEVFHSHNYSLQQFYRRHLGEGRAEAAIFDFAPWERSLLRYSVLPYARQLFSDWRFCLASADLKSAALAPALRMAQLLGRRSGFRRGLKERVA